MLDFELPLINIYTRPILKLYSINVLIDSGAELPIFDIEENTIINAFGGIPLDGDCSVSGIGGTQSARIYRIKEFRIGKMLYRNIPVIRAAINDPNVNVLLGSSMFGGGVKYLVNSADSTIRFYAPDEFSSNGSLWKKHNGAWKQLDYDKGMWIVHDN